MLLKTTTETLQLLMGEGITTAEMTILAWYTDKLAVEKQSSQFSASSGTTAVTILSSPAIDVVREVDRIDIYNGDTVSHDVIIRHYDGTTARRCHRQTVKAGETIHFEKNRGWNENIDTTVWDADANVTGALSVGGNATVTGTLGVTGNVSVANIAASGTLGVTGVSTVDVLKTGAANSVSAHAGGGQASATALTKDNNRVTTCATDADSVKLPAATAGRRVFIKNTTAHTLAIFPASGEVINALSADASISLATVKSMLFVCMVDGTWDTMLTA